MFITLLYINTGGQNSVVGIENRYGLKDPGTESRRGRYFPCPSKQSQRPTESPVQWVPGLSEGMGLSVWGVVLTTHPFLAAM